MYGFMDSVLVHPVDLQAKVCQDIVEKIEMYYGFYFISSFVY